jgi:hypothetical protein
MARRSFDVFDLIELFTHWHAGRSQRQLAESLGIDRKTIAKYLAPAIAESVTPGGEPVTETVWAEHIARWFPEVTDPGLRATTWPGIEVHRDRIRDWLKAEVSAATVAQRCVMSMAWRRRNPQYGGGFRRTCPKRRHARR